MAKECTPAVLSTSKPTLDGLPPEIRLEILKYLLEVGVIALQFVINPLSRRSPNATVFGECIEEIHSRYYQEDATPLGFRGLSSAILAVSKSINAEAAPVLYSENLFVFNYYRLNAFQTIFLARIGQKNRSLIRRIEIGFKTTSELWLALGPDSGRGPVLRENIPENLHQFTMSHKWTIHPQNFNERNIQFAPSSLDEKALRLSKDLDVMANLLNMSMKFIPWLSKIVVGPGRKVSIVEDDASVKHHKGECSITLERGKWIELRNTWSLERYDGLQDGLGVEMIQKHKRGDRLRVEHKERSRGTKPFFMGVIREL